MIEIQDLRKIYRQGGREIAALAGVSLSVAAGQVCGVVGQSGAGKSTLIRCVNGLERPTSGSVRVEGQEIGRLRGRALRAARRDIGMIFQGFNLLSARTAAANVALPLEVAGVDRTTRRARVAELLDLVGLAERADAYPATLSGGQKQRVGIARALAASPRVLLSDEATSALDPATTRAILALLRRLNRELGLTILLITHEMDVVKQICDTVTILEAGEVVEQGSVADLAARPGSRINRAFFPRAIDHPAPPGATRATVTFAGAAADRPVISGLVRDYGVDIDVVGGSFETVGGRRIGQLDLDLSGDGVDRALAHLRGLDLAVEVRA